MSEKLWGGRFEKPTDRIVDDFGASIEFDKRLWPQDIRGSIAHVRMLGARAIIAPDEAKLIMDGLNAVASELESGRFEFRTDLEDIHLNIEARLREKIGPVAGKLHTARSRNDQVSTDLRLFMKEAIDDTIQLLTGLRKALLDQAETNIGLILPGYTHLQRGQPVLLAHHLMAYVEMLRRAIEQLQAARRHTDVLTLGSGALAGVPYEIDREMVAAELGFAAISRNSLDAVSDRDYLIEFCAAAATIMMHLSRLCEEIVIWSSSEFNLVELDDAFTTGSSMMPQKKNPDVAELVRGKTGRVYGALMGLLTILKGLPLAYNKDLQEDKEAVFDTYDTVRGSLAAVTGMIETMRFNEDALRQAAGDPFLLATDFADYLVDKDQPFREAHEIVGRLVRHCIDHGLRIDELPVDDLRQFSEFFADDVSEITVERSVASRDVPGGTAPNRVRAAIDVARKEIDETVAK